MESRRLDNLCWKEGQDCIRKKAVVAPVTIERPNNDTLYAGAMIDVTEEPMVLKLPAFDSTYVSLMVTGYDHYVNIPMSKAGGDFDEPAAILFYSARTPGYDGAPV